MNLNSVINIYESMRDFFPKYQENNKDIILAPRLENILDDFDALLLDVYGIKYWFFSNSGIIKTLDKGRQKNITLLVVTMVQVIIHLKKRSALLIRLIFK